MDELMNRSRTFAEAVGTMVWLVVLAAALKAKSEAGGLGVPSDTLILAGCTIITGILPMLACCIFRNKPAISDVTAMISATMLFYLAYWVATFSVSVEHVLETVTGLSLCCVLVPRIISYCWEINVEGHPERSKDFYTLLDGSHEFLCSMTEFHFLCLESLALEGVGRKIHGVQHALSETMGIISIVCCSGGLFIMHIGMTPLFTWSRMADIPGPFAGPDVIMIFTIAIVLVLAMCKKLVVLQGLVVLFLGLLIAGFVHVRHVSWQQEAAGTLPPQPAQTEDEGSSESTESPKPAPPEEAAGGAESAEPPKLAPLGLTKLMVTGFLTVSMSIGPSDQLIKWFLVFSAAAILSGLIWRLLTQAQVRKTLENNITIHVSKEEIDALALVAFSAKTACFCAHTFVAIASVLLMFEAYYVNQSISAAVPSPAPSCT